MTATEPVKDIELGAAPMHRDRTDGWRYVSQSGDILRDSDGTVLLTSLEAVRFAQRNPALFSSAKAFDLLGSPFQLIPLAVDPPEHRRYRAVLDRNLAPKVLDALEDELRAQARELIEGFAGQGHCDVQADLGRLYPTAVVLTLFGLPLSERDWWVEHAETVLENASREKQEQPAEEVLIAAMELIARLQEQIAEKRAHPGDDILSRLLAISGDEAWTDAEVLGASMVFIFGGLDTVTAMIGFIMLHLARDPALRRQVVADPSLIPPLIEEVLRLEAPAPIVPRVTTEDVEVCGRSIPAGTRVALCLATANREEGTHPNPDGIDLEAALNGHHHLSFGGGIHRCLGSHLARRELKLMIEEFHKLIPEYSLAEGADPQVVWPSQTVHLDAVPLVFPVRTRPAP